MLEIENHKLMTLLQVAKRLPNRPHVSTVARWIYRGVRGRKLISTVLGGRRYVSENSLNEFIASLNAPDPGTTVSGKGQRPREARIKKAYEDLSREGV